MEVGVEFHHDNVLKQQIQSLRHLHLQSLNNVAYILHFISFTFDESMITLLIKCLIQFVVGQKLGGKELREMGVGSTPPSNGVQNMNDVRRQAHQVIMIGSSNDNNDTVGSSENDGIPLSKVRRKLFLVRVLTSISFLWLFIIIFQIVFCLRGISNVGGSHTVWGVFNKTNLKYLDGDSISNGSLMINMIGEAKFQHWFIKLLALTSLNLTTMIIHFYLIILNIGVSLNLMEGLVVSSSNQFDGFQGNVIIYNFSPFTFIDLISSMKKDELVAEYLAEVGPMSSTIGGGVSDIV